MVKVKSFCVIAPKVAGFFFRLVSTCQVSIGQSRDSGRVCSNFVGDEQVFATIRATCHIEKTDTSEVKFS